MADLAPLNMHELGAGTCPSVLRLKYYWGGYCLAGGEHQASQLYCGVAAGNDIRAMKPADLAILSNPAIIAINQDPSGSSAVRRWIWNTNDTDSNFRSTIQMWSGNLNSTTGGTQNDMVVLLINGGNTSTTMNALTSSSITARLAPPNK